MYTLSEYIFIITGITVIFVSLSVQNFAVGWPTISELSSEQKVFLQLRSTEYSGK